MKRDMRRYKNRCRFCARKTKAKFRVCAICREESVWLYPERIEMKGGEKI